MMDRMRSATTLAALALGFAACGSGGGDDGDKLTTPGAAELREAQEPSGRAPEVDPSKVRVVRAWADALRHGHVRAAARYFALPSTVANNTTPIMLETRANVRFFNRTLPCGARLIATEPAPSGFFVATFRLTERPGRGVCGSGTGETARTAFRVRDDHITAWVRVSDEPVTGSES